MTITHRLTKAWASHHAKFLARVATYHRLTREQGLPRKVAARRLGVTYRTAGNYEVALRGEAQTVCPTEQGNPCGICPRCLAAQLADVLHGSPSDIDVPAAAPYAAAGTAPTVPAQECR